MVNLTPNVILLLVTIVVVVVLIILMVGIAVVLETQKKIIKRLKAWKRKNYLCLRKKTEFAEFVESFIESVLIEFVSVCEVWAEIEPAVVENL